MEIGSVVFLYPFDQTCPGGSDHRQRRSSHLGRRQMDNGKIADRQRRRFRAATRRFIVIMGKGVKILFMSKGIVR